jgi:sarcosine oxidase
MTARSFDVLVVGGGVIGSSAAFFLSSLPEARGSRIGVVEPDPTYARSSTALSVGGIRQQFSTPENIRLSLFTTEFLRDAPARLAVDGAPPHLGFVEGGYLFLATEAGIAILEANHSVQTSLGAEVAILDRAALKARYPWMETNDLAAGSVGLRGEGWLDPYSLLQAFRKKALDRGVVYVEDRVVDIEVESQQVRAVRLERGGRASVGSLVNAAGPRAREVAAMAGIPDLPVQPRKRFVYRIQCRGGPSDAPLTIDPSGVYFRPEGPDFLCGVSPDESQDPDTLDLEMEYELFEERVWPILAHRVPAFGALRLGSSWAGHYAVNILDQNAIVGSHPFLPNFFFANGFSGHGLQHAPGVGRAVSELIVHGEYRTIDLTRFGFQRLSAGDLIRERNVV